MVRSPVSTRTKVDLPTGGMCSGFTGESAASSVQGTFGANVVSPRSSTSPSASTASASDFGLSGILTVGSLDYNGFDETQALARLNWANAFDLDEDGAYDDVLQPGAGLAIDFAASLEFAAAGTVVGNGVAPAGTDAEGMTHVLLAAGPIYIGGMADFALERRSVDVDSDGNGAADLIGATLDAVAISVRGAEVVVDGVATLTVTGQLALARVTPANETTARYTALKMGSVVVSASTAVASDFGFSGTLDIDSLDYNAAAEGFSRLDWASAFDLDGDGAFDDLINPGALLPTPADLTIDFASGLQFALNGSISGTGAALHIVHDALRSVSPAAIKEIADILELNPAEVADTMSF